MKDVIERLNQNGGAVYLQQNSQPVVACWFGEKEDRLWFHLGDKPHWGPLLQDLKQHGDYGLIAKDPNKSNFFACIFEEAFELRFGQALDQVEDQRKIMSRATAIALLGDPPKNSDPPPNGQAGEPGVEP